MSGLTLPPDWHKPPAEFSLVPFWFWNDDLGETEIRRQMDDFQAHGVDAFVIHPRVGLPHHLGWMSRPLLAMMRFAIEQAQQRGMWVMLYDEGMYPSGSSAGQVVAENPVYQCRGLVRINLDRVSPGSSDHGVALNQNGEPALTPEQSLVAVVAYQGQRFAIVDRPVDAVIRGLHYLDESGPNPPEDTPPAADLLNPAAVACFIRRVYARYHAEFGDYFGTTVRAIFTDEPHLLGRLRENGIVPGTTGILDYVSDYLGYDFTPYLPALWENDDDTANRRRDYQRALDQRLNETYYQQLYDWCEAHGIALTGHPAEPDATAHMRYFHIPGQDIVWRYIEPDKPSALAGRQSTQAKAAASVMQHQGRRRNANEFCGAYGPELSFAEMRWLANWLLIRGCNLLIPHAFYYSMRGPRQHERPPDVGPNSPWWHTFKPFADTCRRLSWLNTDSAHICQVAILGEHHNLPWRAAQACFQQQIDFNYLDAVDLRATAVIDATGIRIAQQHYHALILDGPPPPATALRLDQLAGWGRLVRWDDDTTRSLAHLLRIVPRTVHVSPPSPALRVRHVRKAGLDWYLCFNESATSIDVQVRLDTTGETWLLDPATGDITPFTGWIRLAGYDLRALIVLADQRG